MALFSKAAVLKGIHGEIIIDEFQVPMPKKGEIILKVEKTGICGTDVNIYEGHLKSIKYPIILGHEVCGIIEQMHDEVLIDSNGREVREGDRIIVVPGARCGKCYYCKNLKIPTKCMNSNAYGFTQLSDSNLLVGGFSQYMHLKHPNTSFFKTNLDPKIAVLIEPLSICVHGFERAGGVRFGDTVVVQGTGAIGLGAIAFAKRSGAAKVIAVGGPKRRLQLAKEFGADVCIDIEDFPNKDERISLVKKETTGNRGSDIVVECTGFPNAVVEGLEYLRDSGKYIELGHFTDRGPVEINPHRHMLKNDVSIYGVWASDVVHMERTLSIIELMELPYEKLVTHHLSLDEIKDAFVAISSNNYKFKEDESEIIKATVDPWKPLM